MKFSRVVSCLSAPIGFPLMGVWRTVGAIIRDHLLHSQVAMLEN